MFYVKQFRELIIAPTLRDLNMYSQVAEELMLLTCAVETEGGRYLKQLQGPALGIYQMEPDTYNDLWQNYINRHKSLPSILIHNFDCNRMPHEERLVYDLRFATAMTRIFYYRIPEKLPLSPHPTLLAQYYKKHYNTHKGKATHDKAIVAYTHFTSG